MTRPLRSRHGTVATTTWWQWRRPPRTKVVVLWPHNPNRNAGAALRLSRWFLRQIFPSATYRADLDEAHIEFVARGDRIEGPELVRRFPEIVRVVL